MERFYQRNEKKNKDEPRRESIEECETIKGMEKATGFRDTNVDCNDVKTRSEETCKDSQ